MHPVFFSIGPVTFYSYGLMLALAIAVCAYLLSRDARELNIPAQVILDLVFWVAMSGIVGARIFYILLNWNYFVANPIEIIMVQHGGLAWQGSFIAGTLAGLWFTKKNALPLLTMLDLSAPYTALGQAIGRIGCFLNGCCYGKPVPWGIYFPVHEAYLHPTQLYESRGLFMIFLVLKNLRPRVIVRGQVFVLYIILASGLRFVNEFFRGDHTTTYGGLSIFQIVSLGIFCTGIHFYLLVVQKQNTISR